MAWLEPPPPVPPCARAGRGMPAAGAILVLIALACTALRAETPAPPLLTRVADLARLAGNWAGTVGDLEMEEAWLEPKGGALHSRIAGAGSADPEEWVWRPAPPPAP